MISMRRHTLRNFLLAAFCVALSPSAPAAGGHTMTSSGPVSFYAVQRAPTTISVDGSLNEVGWQLAEQINDFERILNDYDYVEHSTRAKMLWDDSALYCAFACTDPDIWAICATEDAPMWSEEVVEVFIDPDGDGEEYLELEVNPLNAWVDLKIHHAFPGLDSSIDWDIQGLRTAVQVQGTVNDSLARDVGWTVEIAIPWSALADEIGGGQMPRPGDEWRLNLYRIERKGGRRLKQRIDELQARSEPLRSALDSLKTSDAGTDRNDDLTSAERSRIAELREQLDSVRAELKPLQDLHHEMTEYTTWSETWRQGFHHPDRFGVVRFVQ